MSSNSMWGSKHEPSSSSKKHQSSTPTSKPKSDDWNDVTDPEERRRTQHRISQRNFRDKTHEVEERLRRDRERRQRRNERWERDAHNLQRAGNSYNAPVPWDKRADDLDLPWGEPNLPCIVARDYESASQQQNTGVGASDHLVEVLPHLHISTVKAEDEKQYYDENYLTYLAVRNKTADISNIHAHNLESSSSGTNESVDTESPADESDSSCVDTYAFQRTQKIIDGIMRNFCVSLEKKLAAIIEAAGTHRPTENAADKGNLYAPTSRSDHRGGGQAGGRRTESESGKRSSGGDDDEDSDRDGRRKKQKGLPPYRSQEEKGKGKRFACPYFKRNSIKYSTWTTCCGPGWDQIHRLKGHLYRRHTLPPRCPRCWETFKTDHLLSSHLQVDPPCKIGMHPKLVDGFTKEQETQIRSRKKTHADITDEEKWCEIYAILFPDDDRSSYPSPYYDGDFGPHEEAFSGSGNLRDYAVFVRREMPGLVRRELEVLFTKEFQDIEERTRPRIAQIVMDLQPRLMQLYQRSSCDNTQIQNRIEPEPERGAIPLENQELLGGLGLAPEYGDWDFDFDALLADGLFDTTQATLVSLEPAMSSNELGLEDLRT